MKDYQDYGFYDHEPSHMVRHFLPPLVELAGSCAGSGKRVLDVGCGNGAVCGEFLKRGCTVVGVDLSKTGIELAKKAFPAGRFEILAAGGDILSQLREEPFDLVISTEVVEHLYAPRDYVKGCFSAVKPGGQFICTTPYHGYAKNLIISLVGQWDKHANPLWDGGHIKLWSRKTLQTLLTEAGFDNIRFRGAGRIPYVWMTMVMAGVKTTEKAVSG